MTPIFRLAGEIEALCASKGWRHCFIGGVALQRWGEPRLTGDVDLSILTGFGGEEAFIRVLCGQYAGRVPNPESFALRNRVLLLISDSGIPIDVALAGLPYEERVMDRASSFAFLEDVTLRTCSAEDLVVLKAFADRSRDWADMEGVILRQREALDWLLVDRELAPLCEAKDAPHIPGRLADLRRSLR
jgi:hypothetical protein